MIFYKEVDLGEDKIGRFPSEWQVVKLEDVVRINKESRDPSREMPGRSFSYVDIDSVDGRTGRIRDPKTILGIKAPSRARRVIHEKDVIMSTVRPYLKAFAMVTTKYDNQICSTGFAVLSSTEKILPYFLLNVLFSDLTIDQCNRMMMGGQYPALNKSQVARIEVPLPPLPEQKEIAEVFACVDFAIQKTDEVIAKTERLKMGLMQQLLTRGIGHKEFKDTKVGRIPKEWKVYKLNYLIEKGIITYHLDGNHGELYPRAQEFVGEGVPFLSANMISNGNIDFSKAKYVTEERARQFRKGVAKDGDVLLAHNATVGPVVILKTDLPYVILGTTLTSYRCNSSYLNNQYLKRYMEGPFFQQQLQRIMKQTTRNQVPITAQRQLQFVVPILDEQQRIAEPLDAIDEKLELERKERTTLNRIKLGLMDLLLTGKVRVKVG